MRRVEIDLGRLTARLPAHAYLKKVFAGTEYYGRNLDALRDMLTALPEAHISIRGEANAPGYALKVLRVLRDCAAENPGIDLRVE